MILFRVWNDHPLLEKARVKVKYYITLFEPASIEDVRTVQLYII